MPTQPPPDPFKAFRFRVEIDGIQQAGFMECSALSSHLEIIEYREGGDIINVRKFPGKASYPDITLKWGLTTNLDLYNWHLAGVKGNLQRKNGSVVQLDDSGNEALRWNFFNGWLSKWDGASYNAKGNELTIASVTVSFERMEKA